MWHTVIVTATEWDNFFNLRCHPAAHPEIRKVAELMRDALAASTPEKLDYGSWHLPLLDQDELFRIRCRAIDKSDLPVVQDMIEAARSAESDLCCKVSVGRCARVSYLTHDGKRDPQADIDLHDSLLKNGHMSPFEHVARPMTAHETSPSEARPDECFSGNVRGWIQYRKKIQGEEDMLGVSR
jgi:thymidylate synthase ThyX